jgi:hypothetical protein
MRHVPPQRLDGVVHSFARWSVFSRRQAMLMVPSPAHRLVSDRIMLHRHTWSDKIQRRHPELQLFGLRNTLQDPDMICDSRTRAGDWVFFCDRNTNAYRQGMRVSVRLQGGEHFVTSAYYSGSDHHGPVLWRRGDG